MGVASLVAAAGALVASAPAQAGEIYPRPWGNTITLSGHGFGHGHGMSQWGAYGAASVRKLSWQQILAFYYPGTTLSPLPNASIRVRLDDVGHGVLNVPNAAGLRLASSGVAAKALPQQVSAGVPITRYRVLALSTAGRLRVERLSSRGWETYKDNVTSPAVLSSPTRGIVDVLLSSGRPRGYRGSLVAGWAASSRLTPVNVLPMESYLRAVVPSEMPASWHPNALAAQAVAARSYANQNRASAPAGRVYDTCDTTSCQVYAGVPAEAAASDKAIVATVGKVLTYHGRPAFTQFGSANGGWTAAGSQPYLVAKADPYDGAIPNNANSWTKSIPVATIEASWPSIGTYRQLRIISRDGNGQWGGRVLKAAIDGSRGTVSVTGATIRSAFGLRSDWFIPTNPPSAPSYPRDLTGDGKADVLAVVAAGGDLRLYPGNGASRWGPTRVIGTGFGSYSKVFGAGTWDGDALSDVMARKTDGSLWLFRATASGPLSPPHAVGAGWNIFDVIFPVGDFGGDGASDLVARRPDGALMLYSGNGIGGFLRARQIGNGWGPFTSVFSPGDFSGDRVADVIARAADGSLHLYPGNGSGGWLPARQIGTGWNAFTTITSPGDLSGDGRSDLLGTDQAGRLWLYPGTGTGRFLPRQLVGAGWTIFSSVLP